MERGPVALVLVEGVAGIELVVERHQPISHDLRDDRSAANDMAALIAMDEWPARHRHIRGPGAVDEHEVRRIGKVMNRLLHREEGRPEDVPLVNGPRAHDADPHLGVLEDDGEGLFALCPSESLGVVDTDTQGPCADDYGCGHDRTGPWAASSLIDPGNPAKAYGPGVGLRVESLVYQPRRRRLQIPHLVPRRMALRMGSLPQRQCGTSQWSGGGSRGGCA